MSVPNIITPYSITVFANGKTLVAKSSHPNFKKIQDALKAGARDAAAIAALFDIPAAITAQTNGRVTVTRNEVLYDGKPLHNTLTARMIAMMSEGYSITPLVNFLEKLMKNPSNRAVNGLYDFLAAANIPITPEGDFLAFKKIRQNYFDIHSGKIRNAPGDEPRVTRNQVDEDPDRTCSHGLHVCSESYLPHFSSDANDRVVICQVNPADVVAIPRDYNNAKMRCAGYKVIGEVTGRDLAKAFNAPVMGASNFAESADASNSDSYDTLSDEADDIIRDIEGIIVNFMRDREGEEWVAYFTDSDGNEDEYFTGMTDLEDAVEDFKAEMMEEVQNWSAELRWLDEDGDLHIEVVEITASVEDEPLDDDFRDELFNIRDDLDYDLNARVVNIQEVGTAKWRIVPNATW